MKSQFIKELKDGETVNSSFLVKKKLKGVTKEGKPYLTVYLGDKSGDIEGKIWDRAADYETLFEARDVVQVSGQAVMHRDKIQIKIRDLYTLKKEQIEIGDYLPVSPYPTAEQWRKLCALLQTVKEPHLAALIELLIKDAALIEAFQKAPAGKQIHHSYCGGLLDHTLSMAKLADFISGHYPFLNRDLLLVGVFVHDLGKVEELDFRSAFEYSDEGKLVGHLLLGCRLLEKKIAQLPQFPRKLQTMLMHFILSHHGELEFGSPVLPQTLEAMALHQLDLLDSKLEHVRTLVLENGNGDETWTEYSRVLSRSFYKEGASPLQTVASPPPEAKEARRELDLFGAPGGKKS